MKERFVRVPARGRELWGMIAQQGVLILGYAAAIGLVWLGAAAVLGWLSGT